MIKSNKGRVELKGTPIVLVGELGTAIQAVYQALLNAGIDKTFAEKNIRKTCELALLTDEEQEDVLKGLDKKIDEKKSDNEIDETILDNEKIKKDII